MTGLRALPFILLTASANADAQVVFHVDFDHDAPGPYTRAELAQDFHPAWADGIDEGLADIVKSDCGMALRVRYTANAVGKGVIIPVRLPRRDGYYLSYRVFFPNGFTFVKEGKLSGLCGGACNSGGVKSTGNDGWSSRVIWRQDGKLAQYVYSPDQAGQYGDIRYWDGAITTGRWHVVQTYVQVNNPDKADGIIRSWLDGRLVYSDEKARLRTTSAFAVDTFKFETFFGGGSSDFAPGSDQYALFDDITVSEHPITLPDCPKV